MAPAPDAVDPPPRRRRGPRSPRQPDRYALCLGATGRGTAQQRAELGRGRLRGAGGSRVTVIGPLGRRPDLGQRRRQHPRQTVGVAVEAARAELERLAAHEPRKAVGQLVRPRHPCAIHEDRDDAHIARQRRFDFQADEVVGVVEPPPAALVGDRQPLVADQGQQHITRSDSRGDRRHEVVAQGDRVDVLEDLRVAEPLVEPVVQPARRIGGLFSSVTDEHPARRGRRALLAHRRTRGSIAPITPSFPPTHCSRHDAAVVNDGSPRPGRW